MYVLLIIVTVSGYQPEIESIRFDTEQTCEAAREWVANEISEEVFHHSFSVKCLREE